MPFCGGVAQAVELLVGGEGVGGVWLGRHFC